MIHVRHESEEFCTFALLAFTVQGQIVSVGASVCASAITLFYERSRDFCDSKQSANMSCTQEVMDVR